MSKVKIKNAILNGSVVIPPSKSAAHRALLCSFLAGGGTVSPIIPSKDMQAMQQAISALENDDKIVDCIESGNTLRFVIPVAAALGKSVTFVGSGRLPERPLETFLELLPKHNIKCTSNGRLPLSIEGKLTAGKYEIAGNISSQYISGLLFALPILDGDSEIVLTTRLESKPYIDLTIKVMRDFGVEVQETESGYLVRGNQQYKTRDYIVESDWSQAAFFLVGGAVGKSVALKGLDMNSVQGDKAIVDILKKFGADIEIKENEIISRKAELKGIKVDVSDIPDTVPALAVAAAYANGRTEIVGGERLRFKESDRIESVVSNLKRLGADVTETSDGMIINGGKKLKGAELLGYNDHRIVMAFSIAALFAGGETIITEANSINKTYPSFFEDYNRIGGQANVFNNRK
ncbi:3-phosphoshikimate 1-carboxyvinyltransferase [Clostridiales bacterium]|nr:3-phosphoshikimate 1-carboxyvinyltransferase [Clostridiales bacterium]